VPVIAIPLRNKVRQLYNPHQVNRSRRGSPFRRNFMQFLARRGGMTVDGTALHPHGA